MLKTPEEKRYFSRTALIILGGMILVAGGLFAYPKILARFERWQEERRVAEIQENMAEVPEETFSPLPEEDTEADPPEIPEPDFLEKMAALSPEDIPAEKLLSVPFICQNPYRNEEGWKVHKESCEEAALLQAILYLSGKTVSPDEANEIFLDMIAWQKRSENFGAHIDLYGEDMRKFIMGYYSLTEEEVIHLQNLDAEKIRKVITLGYPLIVPIQGNLLNNPFYPEPGYHMMTVIGYNQEGVITNDVGTKRGEKYPYAWKRFLQANEPVGGDALVVLK